SLFLTRHTSKPETHTLSLHDALPILKPRYKQEFDAAHRERLLDELRKLQRKLGRTLFDEDVDEARRRKEVSPPYHFVRAFGSVPDRKSTRLNSSHVKSSYAVFCLKQK